MSLITGSPAGPQLITDGTFAHHGCVSMCTSFVYSKQPNCFSLNESFEFEEKMFCSFTETYQFCVHSAPQRGEFLLLLVVIYLSLPLTSQKASR